MLILEELYQNLVSRLKNRKTLPLLDRVLDNSNLKKTILMYCLHGRSRSGGIVNGWWCYCDISSFCIKYTCHCIHYMEAHLLSPMLEEKVLVFHFWHSCFGGIHRLFQLEIGVMSYWRVLDDAAGEAFDKVAKR